MLEHPVKLDGSRKQEMKSLHLYIDSCQSPKTNAGAYGVVAKGFLNYTYAEELFGVGDKQETAEVLGACEALLDLAERIKGKVALANLDLTFHSDNNTVVSVFTGRKCLSSDLASKFPYLFKIVYQIGRLEVRQTLAGGSNEMQEADKLGRKLKDSRYSANMGLDKIILNYITGSGAVCPIALLSKFASSEVDAIKYTMRQLIKSEVIEYNKNFDLTIKREPKVLYNGEVCSQT